MAKAGYDPALALNFWRRMMTDEYVKLSRPQFLKGHPRDDSHMQALVVSCRRPRSVMCR